MDASNCAPKKSPHATRKHSLVLQALQLPWGAQSRLKYACKIYPLLTRQALGVGSVSETSGDLDTWRPGLETDDSVVSLQVALVRESDLETDD